MGELAAAYVTSTIARHTAVAAVLAIKITPVHEKEPHMSDEPPTTDTTLIGTLRSMSAETTSQNFSANRNMSPVKG